MDNTLRKNEEINDQKIKLVLEDGEMHGEISSFDAFSLSSEKGLDLIEVCPSNNGDLAICKLMNYGKMKYDREKKCKKMHKEVTKIMKFHLNISDHDLDIKNRKVLEFLSKRKKVQYMLELRGGEKRMIDAAKEKMEFNLEGFRDKATWKEVIVKDNKSGILVLLNPI